ncbi:polysaccharide deacetylase [Clostridiaceae bacterium 14S0207]|nr:polysaccharide deacetylase [Clostridiaceae bacterium 14S0207]
MYKNKFLIAILCISIFLGSVFMVNPIIEANEETGKTNGKKEKVVYLTFDDGPSINNTKKVLEILKKENIPATFFLIGENAERNPDIVKELLKNNMAIGEHTFSHKTHYIYKSSQNYIKDLNQCLEVLDKIIGKKYINIVRMPGGSTNTICNKAVKKQIKNSIKEKGFDYIDWNVSGEDAISKNVALYKIKNNVFKYSKNKDCIVVLLHDGYYNSNTVKALPEIIKYYKDRGYTFKSLKNISKQDKERLERLKILNR